jgi:hypothetical protein
MYLRWDDDRFTVLIGTYRAGFAQRLVFDNSGAELPNGLFLDDQLIIDGGLTRACKETAAELPSPCSATSSEGAKAYVTPDFRWRDSLLGIALGGKRIPFGPGALQLYGWGSYAKRSIYQYELFDRRTCGDPRRDDDVGCMAPQVYRRPAGALLTPTTRHSYQTLPNVFAEPLLGSNVTFAIDRRSHIGATGYLAWKRNLVAGIDLDTQEWSRLPLGRRFGAVGADLALGRAGIDVSAEVARSFDRLAGAPGGLRGGGGIGAVVRLTASSPRQELDRQSLC